MATLNYQRVLSILSNAYEKTGHMQIIQWINHIKSICSMVKIIFWLANANSAFWMIKHVALGLANCLGTVQWVIKHHISQF